MSFRSRFLFTVYILLSLGAGGCATYVAPAAKDLPDEQLALVDSRLELYVIKSVDAWNSLKPYPSHIKLTPGEHTIGLRFWGSLPKDVPSLPSACTRLHPFYVWLAFAAAAGRRYVIESASASRNPFWMTLWIRDLATGEKVSRVVLDDSMFHTPDPGQAPCPLSPDETAPALAQPQPGR